MIIGAHSIVYSGDPDATRAFFRDALRMPSVDAGGGWLIFALPPAELGIHPAEESAAGSELYFMCEKLDETLRELEAKGARTLGKPRTERWGRVVMVEIPGGVKVGVYEPYHATALHLTVGARQSAS